MDLADPSSAEQRQFRNHLSSGFSHPSLTPGRTEYEYKQCFDMEYMFYFASSTSQMCQAF
ncbi:hypothetical protein BS627_18935 [Agrobacterium salinitolerans]|uniref:Uncharacterized protein n=1 Tax=Agrobacterium salinitolerans TaxID=1183413 RepID=A0ABY3BMT6_9HYPH|nr:hypothetical protein [Agrobacterium salinitolerans]OOO18067.1 hypothetical protein BS627_18935 [Agrobacterium salinitolerans]PNQ21440.1 hypothetical protein C2E26_19260 [Rhizobium sp. YIC5082]TRA88454.1 hypothetical protein EXN23_15895 [Agrobacterium salinitolerans]